MTRWGMTRWAVLFVRQRETSFAFDFEPVEIGQLRLGRFRKLGFQPAHHLFAVGRFESVIRVVEFKLKTGQRVAAGDPAFGAVQGESFKKIIAVATGQNISESKSSQLFTDSQKMIARDAPGSAGNPDAKFGRTAVVIEVPPDGDHFHVARRGDGPGRPEFGVLLIEEGEGAQSCPMIG
jgi:hypothetical protein